MLDPFAGVGGIHQLAENGYLTAGVEIEPAWACAHPRTIVGDATALVYDNGTFDAVVTSPAYGNRMADSYDGGRDRCKVCALTTGDEECPGCDGTGFASSKRYTYRTYLGTALAENNAGGMQWGPRYRELHTAAWREVARVLKPGGLFFLNISDHYRAGRLQGVDLWHANVCGRLGFELIAQEPVVTQRSKNGANHELRDSCEWILVFRSPVSPVAAPL